MSVQHIKKLMGSATYGIRLEMLEALKKIEDIFVRIELYYGNKKNSEIIVSNFQSLIDNISHFWSKDAKMEIYPRKMATWLSDYLRELGYPKFDFDFILNAIMHKMEDEKELNQLSKFIDLQDPDVKPKTQKIDLEIPSQDKDKFLANQIDNFLVEVPRTIKSSIYYIDQEGKVLNIEAEQDIIKSEEDAKQLTSITTFENPLEISLKDIQINNIIPYGYRVKEINTVGFEGIEPLKKLLDDGFQLTWTIPELKPKQEAKIELNLERRISRTILMNIENDTNIINTYFNIVPYKNLYSASDSFTNIHNEQLDNLILEDEIPTTFNLFEIEPTEDTYKINMQKEGFEQLVKWQYHPYEAVKKISHVYYLMDKPFFILNKILIKSKNENEKILEIIKLIEPNVRFYELTISYYLKFYKRISELYIKEIIPENVNVTIFFPNTIEKSLVIENGKIIQIWKIIPEISQNLFEFGYICSGESIKNEFPIEILIPEMKTYSQEEKSTESERKCFLLPELHQFLQQYIKTAI